VTRPPRPQDLNASILRLARDKGQLADKDLHALLGGELGAAPFACDAAASPERMLFSASVNLAKRRLLRYALLQLDARNRASITARGEIFLARGFTRLDARVRRHLDEAWLDATRAAERTNADADAVAQRADGEEPGSGVRALLDEAGLSYFPVGESGAVVPLATKLRTWLVEARESNGWLCMRTHVMGLPEPVGARTSVVDAAMKANADLTMWRFAIAAATSTIVAEVEDRLEHVDGKALAALIFMLGSNVDAQFARLVTVASGQSPLDELEAAFKRSA